MNKCIFVGNLVADPSAKMVTVGGENVDVCTFRIAVNRPREDVADFVKVTVWRGLATNCQRFLSKGKKVAVVGTIAVQAYIDRDGQARASLELNASEVEFLSPRAATTTTCEISEAAWSDVGDENLPF